MEEFKSFAFKSSFGYNSTIREGKIYNFYGTGAEITKNPNYIKLQTRNLNRIYKAIQKDF